MDYIVYGWGLVFGIWLSLMLVGFTIFFVLFKNTKIEDKNLST